MRIFRYQLANIINRIEFKVCFGVLMALVIASFLTTLLSKSNINIMYLRQAADYFILNTTDDANFHILFSCFSALIPSIMCSGCIKNDMQTGYIVNPILKMTKKQFIFGNAASVVIVAFFSYFIVLGMNQLFCLCAFPVEGFDNNFGQPWYSIPSFSDENVLLDFWYTQNTYLYNLFFSIMTSLFAGGVALLVYGLGFLKIFFRFKPIILSVAVFIAFLFLSFVADFLWIPKINYLSYVQTKQLDVYVIDYIVFILIIYLIGTILTIKGWRNYEVL